MHYHSSFFLFSSFVLTLSLVTPVACAFGWNNNNGITFDATCDPTVPGTTITKKEWIKAEWVGALDLAKDASERMQLTHVFAGTGTVESRKSVIDGKDPAYGKFMAYETQLSFRDHFSQVWRRMLEFMNSPPGTGARPAGGRGEITVVCDEEEEAQDGKPVPPCPKGGGSSAYTEYRDYTKEENCDIEEGPIMHICPPFFWLAPRHAVINKAKTFPNKDALKRQATTDPLYVNEALYDSLRVMDRDFQMPGESITIGMRAPSWVSMIPVDLLNQPSPIRKCSPGIFIMPTTTPGTPPGVIIERAAGWLGLIDGWNESGPFGLIGEVDCKTKLMLLVLGVFIIRGSPFVKNKKTDIDATNDRSVHVVKNQRINYPFPNIIDSKPSPRAGFIPGARQEGEYDVTFVLSFQVSSIYK
ncbi:hypothetical protein EJ08DRAFT_660565 [Tothia fuscella]|uniref:Uncharacterized protein n=1 Tax=Tothia fuscella TaxID=1048955 RepID=A0A9P4NRZ5_9PEZI|nr:hypothetical protein EJ08DRAFT_660565 [Tothia fuscella]